MELVNGSGTTLLRMRCATIVSVVILGTVLGVTAPPAPAEPSTKKARPSTEPRIATQLSAARTTYYVHLDPTIGYQWQQTCIARPLGYGDLVCAPGYPPYVYGPSTGSSSGWARLTDLAGSAVAGAAVRFVGHLTRTTCTVPTDLEGYAWPWCEVPLGWSIDEQGYDVFFDGNEVYAPAKPVSSPGANVVA